MTVPKILDTLHNVTDYVTIVDMARVCVRASEAADWAIAHGRSALTNTDLARLLDVPEDQVRRRLHAPARRVEWVMPVRGLWVPVPLEYRTWGAPPGIEIVDVMMRHLNVDYYVGWLSAAALHGAAHQAPQAFQVAVTRHVRDRTVGRSRFEFAQRDVGRVSREQFPTRSGIAQVSSVAATALDISADVSRAGGIDNAASVICELAEHDHFRARDVVEQATGYPAAALRRIGYVLERFSEYQDLDIFKKTALGAGATPSRLDPTGPPSGPVDRTWMVYVNREVEPDA